MSNESPPWRHADVSVTLELARDLVTSVAPFLSNVVYLHEGWDSRVFLGDGEWIFRFPKHKASAFRLGAEIALLPKLAPRLLPVAIPHFEIIGQPSEQYPYSFVGYRKLPGEPIFLREDAEPIEVCTIAADLGRLCAAMHSFPESDAIAAGIRRSDDDASHMDRAISALDNARSAWTDVPEILRERLVLLLQDVPAVFTGAPVLCHADIAPEHLLTNKAGDRLSGLIDFGDLMLGDPASDLSGAMLLGGAQALEAALRNYTRPLDTEAFLRARFYAACRIADDLAYGVGDARPVYVRAALRALEWL